jgi:invasion protein IalB
MSQVDGSHQTPPETTRAPRFIQRQSNPVKKSSSVLTAGADTSATAVKQTLILMGVVAVLFAAVVAWAWSSMGGRAVTASGPSRAPGVPPLTQSGATPLQTAEAKSGNSPQQPQAQNSITRTETITYGSWTVDCQTTAPTPTSSKQCIARLQATEQNSKQILLNWIIGRNNQGVLTTVLNTPTGVQIAQGVELKFGENAVHKLSYVLCGPRRCEAAMPMDAVLISNATAADKAVVTFVGLEGKNISITLPIQGIDKAIDSVQK